MANHKIIDVDFRQMISWLKGGDQLTHQIHPYPAKLLPQIAHFFCRASILQDPNGILLDPFSGSGTVALEASVAGIKPYVADANPFALMLTRVKTNAYNVEELRLYLDILRRTSARYRSAPSIEVVNSHIWYHKELKISLERILRAIREVEQQSIQEFFLVCFSVLARKLSLADPRVSVPVRQKTKVGLSNLANAAIQARFRWLDEVSPFDEFVKICCSNIDRVNLANTAAVSRPTTVELGNDARNLKIMKNNLEISLPNASVGLMITSPPYGSAQKYVRASSLTLNWLGLAGPKDLSNLEQQSIGREHLSEKELLSLEKIPKKYQSQLIRISQKNMLRAKLAATYMREMKSVVAELARVSISGGRNVIIIGNNRVCGEIIENDRFMQECFEANGMSTELVLRDSIRARGLMTTRNGAAPAIAHETILVFRKGS